MKKLLVALVLAGVLAGVTVSAASAYGQLNAGVALFVGASRADATVVRTSAASAMYVGTIPSARTSIAVVTSTGGKAIVYVCDGVETSVWFTGTVTGGKLRAASKKGQLAKAAVTASRVTGTVSLPGKGSVAFNAPRARGVAGMYLVKQSATTAGGFSAARARLKARLTSDSDGTSVSGKVTAAGGRATPLKGSISSFGTKTGVATWIVQSSGDVDGRVTGTAGGGNCSIWQSIKSLTSGVFCGFL